MRLRRPQVSNAWRTCGDGYGGGYGGTHANHILFLFQSFSAIHIAACENHVELLTYLLRVGAEKNTIGKWGCTLEWHGFLCWCWSIDIVLFVVLAINYHQIVLATRQSKTL